MAPICRQWYRPEACLRLAPRVGGAEAARNMLLRLAFDVKRELLVELPFDTVRKRERAHTENDVAESHAPHASFMTRPIAVDMRSHSRASTVSCRRPAAVRR